MAATLHMSDGMKLYLADSYAAVRDLIDCLSRAGVFFYEFTTDVEVNDNSPTTVKVVVNLAQVSHIHEGHT